MAREAFGRELSEAEAERLSRPPADHGAERRAGCAHWEERLRDTEPAQVQIAFSRTRVDG